MPLISLLPGFPHPLVQGDAPIGPLHILHAFRTASLEILLAELIGVCQNACYHILFHGLPVQQRGHPVLHLSQPAIHIGLERGGEEQSGVVGAEVVQIEVDGSFDEGGETAAPILTVAAFQNRFFLRRQVQGKFLFLAQNGLLSGG